MQTSKTKLWHRCGTCGMIFADIKELQKHMATQHGQTRRPVPRLAPEPIKPAERNTRSVVS